MEKNLNRKVANWLASKSQITEKRNALEDELTRLLDNNEKEHYLIYVDYDPRGLFQEAIQNIGVKCDGFLFSHKGLFPAKTGIKRKGNVIAVKEGYGVSWRELA